MSYGGFWIGNGGVRVFGFWGWRYEFCFFGWVLWGLLGVGVSFGGSLEVGFVLEMVYFVGVLV